MKLMLAYFLLGLYAAVMLKPLMPQFADSLAHVMNYSDHVRIIHNENGEGHVHDEYARQAKAGGTSDTNNAVSKQFNAATEHLICSGFTNDIPSLEPRQLAEITLLVLPNLFPETALHPPRV